MLLRGAYYRWRKRDEDGEPNMNAALPFFLLGLPLVLAAYDLVRVRPEKPSADFRGKILPRVGRANRKSSSGANVSGSTWRSPAFRLAQMFD
jgi:hypothetical protein